MPTGKRLRRLTSNPSLTGGSLEPAVYEGLAGMRLAMRRFLSFSEAAVSEAGVTSQQYQTLLVIKTAPGSQIMVRELAEQMLVQHHGAVQLIDRLVAAGLVLRVPSDQDKRSVLVALTSDGEELIERLARIHLEGILANERLLVESLKKLRRLERLS
ncbi:MarR family transcriptional regulator (plasmid) [Rhizobium jaguaris]|uniref:MarR family transcriptional regulator n=1 Tax=Rhizobium jaguaris TaxID=1312183 RepID=A0A387FX49_9HYPH|nr:MarR family transcriptional regulator [Rhizobium jaguaris]